MNKWLGRGQKFAYRDADWLPSRLNTGGQFVRSHRVCESIAKAEQRPLLCRFLDVKAYDNVPHVLLFVNLTTMNFTAPLLTMVQHLYEDNTTIAHFGSAQSLPVKVTRGLRQGCSLSPLLYILYVANMERKLLSSGLGFQLKYSTMKVDEMYRLPGLTFADDVVLIKSAQDLQDLIHISQVEITRLGLHFNCRTSAVVSLAGTCTDEVTQARR